MSLNEPWRALAPLVAVRSGVTADEVLPADDREPHAGVLRWIAAHRLGPAAPGHELGLLQHPLAHCDHAAVALAQVLLGAVGEGALTHPGDEVLVHYVRGDPAPRACLVNWAVPVRD